VISTADGRVVSTITGEGQGVNFSGFHDALFDPAMERLYLPFVQTEQLADGPLPLHVAAYDINTGKAVGRAEFPEILVGSWFPEESSDLGIVSESLTPGIAVSPDGSRLAIVDPLTRIVTTVDTSTMSVVAAVTPHRSVSWTKRVLEFLSPLPRAAEAKLYNGVTLGAYFSADGQFLYVTGRSAEVGDTMAEVKVELLGVQRIELATGEITAGALDDVDVIQLWVDSENGAIFAQSYEEPWETSADGAVETHLRRLDAETLKVTADRELTAQEQVTVLPLPAR
jgi:hypothetical protein